MQKRVCIDVHPAEMKFMLKHFSLDNKQRLWNLCEFAFAPYNLQHIKDSRITVKCKKMPLSNKDVIGKVLVKKAER